jgi:hypothetical protein
LAGISAFIAVFANLLDVIPGFGENDFFVYGTRSAAEWFSMFQMGWFKGLYTLGILNFVYMLCMIPVYLAICWFVLSGLRLFELAGNESGNDERESGNKRNL